MPETIENWGRNVRFTPEEVFKPPTEAELLAFLNKHNNPDRSVRALGAKYSWSEVVACNDVLIDLGGLDTGVHVHHEAGGKAWAEIGANGRVKQVLSELDRQGGYTLPAYGILDALSIAGSVATATHGSGRASLAHYVTGVRAAAYDAARNEARIYEWNDGIELQAARCALGCMGLLLSLRFDLEPRFLLEEQLQKCESISEALKKQDEYPLQQFYLVPWSWRWLAQCRRRAEEGRNASWYAGVYRWYRYIVVEVVFHKILTWLTKLPFKKRAAMYALYRWVFPVLTLSFLKKGLKVTDRAERLLTLSHDLFQHLEMELFVPAEHVGDAAEFVKEVLRYCGSKLPKVPSSLREKLEQTGGRPELERLRNSYVHDYLITFRHVLPDETLISMSGGDKGDEKKARYAISLITYDSDHYPFLAVCRFLAVAMAKLFDARPHWGKICPLGAGQLEELYPRLAEFREQCLAVDPKGVFQNEFTRQKLGC